MCVCVTSRIQVPVFTSGHSNFIPKSGTAHVYDSDDSLAPKLHIATDKNHTRKKDMWIANDPHDGREIILTPQISDTAVISAQTSKIK